MSFLGLPSMTLLCPGISVAYLENFDDEQVKTGFLRVAWPLCEIARTGRPDEYPGSTRCCQELPPAPSQDGMVVHNERTTYDPKIP